MYCVTTGVGYFLVKISEEQIGLKLLTEFDQVYGKNPQKVVIHQVAYIACNVAFTDRGWFL